MLLAGLWYSDKKPAMQTYLKPICKMLLKLESEGKYNYGDLIVIVL